MTGSGLSITEWDPIMGAIPPLNDAQWADAFAKYSASRNIVLENRGMSLEAFKGIFWWEWTHRFLGRLLGVVFFVPFLWFAWKGAIQQKRLAAHAGAVRCWAGCRALSAGGWWRAGWRRASRSASTGWRSIWARRCCCWSRFCGSRWNICATGKAPPKPAGRAFGFVALVYVQMLLGALVAGLHAGLIYNTWPDMNGHVFPEDPFFSSPWWINFFENPGLAQFDHRIGAYIVAGFAVWIYARGVKLSGACQEKRQAGGGDHRVPDRPGHRHPAAAGARRAGGAAQVTAAALFCAAVWHAYELRHRPA